MLMEQYGGLLPWPMFLQFPLPDPQDEIHLFTRRPIVSTAVVCSPSWQSQ